MTDYVVGPTSLVVSSSIDLVRCLKFTRFDENGVDVTDASSWTELDYAGSGSAFTAPGVLTVASVSQSGTILVKSVRNGVELTQEVAVTYAPLWESDLSEDYYVRKCFYLTVYHTSYGYANSVNPTIKAGPTGRIRVNCRTLFGQINQPDRNFVANDCGGDLRLLLKPQIKIGAAWVDMAPEVSPMTPYTVELVAAPSTYDQHTGQSVFEVERAGLTPGASYGVRLTARVDSLLLRHDYLGTFSKMELWGL